jgi:hypothetical protein
VGVDEHAASATASPGSSTSAIRDERVSMLKTSESANGQSANGEQGAMSVDARRLETAGKHCRAVRIREVKPRCFCNAASR